MDLNSQLKRKSYRVNEETLVNLRKEYRLHYTHPVELHNTTDEDLLYFETSKFLFYGYKVESMMTSYDSDKYDEKKIASYLGIMMFYGGETYIGELNSSFKPHGEGMMFFSVGAVMRGYFIEGKAHGNALISLPSEVNVLARLDKGVIHKQLVKLDYKSNLVNYLKYVQGNFIEYEKESFIDEDLIAYIKDAMGNNIPPDHIKSYNDGSLYFGTFISSSDSLYYGFVKDGEPAGWGVIVDIATIVLNESKFIQESLSWRLSNYLNESESVAIGINQDGNMIFGLESQGVLYGELGVYIPAENRFQKAAIKEGLLEFEDEYFEGIPKNFVTNIYLEYLKNKRLPKRELNIVPIVFDLTYFNDLFFFYLYGHLKEKSREIFKDNLQLSQEGFFKNQANLDSNTYRKSDSIGNNLDFNNPINSEDMTIFELQSGIKARNIHSVQSEIKKGRMSNSGGLEYVTDRDHLQSFDNKLSMTTGMSEDPYRKKSSFSKVDRRISKTNSNVRDDNLIVIEELNEDFKKSRQSKDIKSAIATINKTLKTDLDDSSYQDRNVPNNTAPERSQKNNQSRQYRPNYEDDQWDISISTRYASPLVVENTKEIIHYDDTIEPQVAKQQKETPNPKYKEKSLIIEEIKAKMKYLLPPSYMKQLTKTNPKFFGS